MSTASSLIVQRNETSANSVEAMFLRNDNLYICPECQLLFHSSTPWPPRAYVCSEKDSDFRPRYVWVFNPVKYFVKRCPGCKFTAPQREFTQPDNMRVKREHEVPVPEFLRRGDSTSSPEPPEDTSTQWISEAKFSQLPVDHCEAELSHQPYVDAAERKKKSGGDALTIAELLHQAAWCARVDADSELEVAMLAQAAHWYTVAVEETSLPPDERTRALGLIAELQQRSGPIALDDDFPLFLQAKLLYVIGELHRRCGQFALADDFFQRAAAEPMTDQTAAWLPNMIACQGAFARNGNASNQPLIAEEPSAIVWPRR